MKFGDTEIEEYDFHQCKNPISINNIDLSKIVSNIYQVILLDSVCEKNESYYPKVFLEKFIHNFFCRGIINLVFRTLEVPLEI